MPLLPEVNEIIGAFYYQDKEHYVNAKMFCDVCEALEGIMMSYSRQGINNAVRNAPEDNVLKIHKIMKPLIDHMKANPRPELEKADLFEMLQSYLARLEQERESHIKFAHERDPVDALNTESYHFGRADGLEDAIALMRSFGLEIKISQKPKGGKLNA